MKTLTRTPVSSLERTNTEKKMGKKGKEKKRKKEKGLLRNYWQHKHGMKKGLRSSRVSLGERLWKPFLVDDIQDLIYPWVTSVFFC